MMIVRRHFTYEKGLIKNSLKYLLSSPLRSFLVFVALLIRKL